MTETPHEGIAATQGTPLPPPTPASPTKTPSMKRILLIIAMSIGSAIVLGVVIIGILVILGVGLFVNTIQGYSDNATTSANKIEAQMKLLRIGGKAPHKVISGITDRNGEDIFGVETVPTVDATFLVAAPSVTAAQAEVYKDLRVVSSHPLTLWPGGADVRGLEELVTLSDKSSYYVLYFFPTRVTIAVPEHSGCNAIPEPAVCTDAYFIVENHLTDQPVANIRVSV